MQSPHSMNEGLNSLLEADKPSWFQALLHSVLRWLHKEGQRVPAFMKIILKGRQKII